jgi:starch phosphorylase
MVPAKKAEGVDNGHIYKVSVAATRPSSDYTPRIIPNFPGISVPLETNLILWQR